MTTRPSTPHAIALLALGLVGGWTRSAVGSDLPRRDVEPCVGEGCGGAATDACAGDGCDVELPVDVGVTTSMNKVFFEDPTDFHGVMGGEARVELARNEYEATQIVLFPLADVERVEVSVSDLRRVGGGGAIPADDVTINVVGYVNLLAAKVEGDRVGWHPDPLLPNQPLDLAAGVLQPYLVTVYARLATPAGDYVGSLLIRAPGATGSTGSTATAGASLERRVTLRAHVWDFEVPKTGRFRTAALAGWGILRDMWPGVRFSDDQRMTRMLALADLGFRNRLPPTPYLANGLRSWDWRGDGNTDYGFPTHDGHVFNAERTGRLIDYMLDHGANNFWIALTSNIYALPDRVDVRERRLRDYLEDYAPYLRSRGLADMAYVYGVDEPWGDAVGQARKVYSFVHGIVPDVAFLQNTNQDNRTIIPDLLGYFDALDVTLGWFDVTRVDGYRRQHPRALDDLWWNVNLWPDGHPNLFLEYPLVDARIIGPMSYAFRVQGFEYWQLFSRGSIGSYHPIASDELRVRWNVDKRSLDGTLVYPGAEGVIYSSLRYESFRDGIEDAEFLYLLEARHPDHPLLRVNTVTSISRYATDPAAILEFRRRVAAAIEAP